MRRKAFDVCFNRQKAISCDGAWPRTVTAALEALTVSNAFDALALGRPPGIVLCAVDTLGSQLPGLSGASARIIH